ncbi:hypothetical protein DFR72_103270 [Lentzea flaviverrucosa]|uniref:Uncharacterized protein n=1 Tax=Lentzea flaviverrucosa TaxID=200379 RepID=A0A1H9B6C1_9PSEU|nr:hypothetical protein DFR72_103270 [Lentzea flaviverrucosa]SEP84494.1 hypothetical protein SAMN05216195_101388 [Lentzea flaviverrucosa]
MTGDDAERRELKVNLPVELPVLTRRVSRILLDILFELSEAEALNGPPGGRCDDC